MRDFIFVMKSDENKKATVRVDMIDDKSEKFTILWMESVSGTEFEKYLPWKLGDVTDEDEIEAVFLKLQPIMKCTKFGGSSIKTFGVEEYVLTITPSITNGDKTSVIVYCENSDGYIFEKVIEIEDGKTSEVEIIKGFDYLFKLTGDNTWTTEAPDVITCEGDESVSIAISMPIVLPIHTMTITPTLTDGTETTVTLTGELDGYTTTIEEIELKTGETPEISVYEGYSYEFTLDDNDTWTSGTAPDAIVCDGDESVSLGITVVTV